MLDLVINAHLTSCRTLYCPVRYQVGDIADILLHEANTMLLPRRLRHGLYLDRA